MYRTLFSSSLRGVRYRYHSPNLYKSYPPPVYKCSRILERCSGSFGGTGGGASTSSVPASKSSQAEPRISLLAKLALRSAGESDTLSILSRFDQDCVLLEDCADEYPSRLWKLAEICGKEILDV
jgi:hypothetical protein